MNNQSEGNKNLAYVVTVQHKLGTFFAPFGSREEAWSPEEIRKFIDGPITAAEPYLQAELEKPLILTSEEFNEMIRYMPAQRE